MTSVGILVGIAAVAACARLLESRFNTFDAAGPRWSLARYEHVDSAMQLYGLNAMDPKTVCFAVSVLCVFASLAACLPARRATGIDPVQTLREE